MKYCLSVDLGSEKDYTALSLIKRVEKIRDDNIPSYNSRPIREEPVIVVSELHLIRMDRIQLKTPYPVIVRGIKAIVNSPNYIDNIALIVDQTGVGGVVMQLLYQAGLAPIGITIHGGNNVTTSKDNYGVPKRDLAMALLTAYQMKQVKVPPPSIMPIIKDYEEELQNFIMKINKETGFDSYEAATERVHDDLVMSMAMGIYWINKTHGITSTLEERRQRD